MRVEPDRLGQERNLRGAQAIGWKDIRAQLESFPASSEACLAEGPEESLEVHECCRDLPARTCRNPTGLDRNPSGDRRRRRQGEPAKRAPDRPGHTVAPSAPPARLLQFFSRRETCVRPQLCGAKRICSSHPTMSSAPLPGSAAGSPARVAWMFTARVCVKDRRPDRWSDAFVGAERRRGGDPSTRHGHRRDLTTRTRRHLVALPALRAAVTRPTARPFSV